MCEPSLHGCGVGAGVGTAVGAAVVVVVVVVVVVALHDVLPAGDHVPGMHEVHMGTPAEVLKVPAAHGRHASWELT
jgi:hypothetical protein